MNWIQHKEGVGEAFQDTGASEKGVQFIFLKKVTSRKINALAQKITMIKIFTSIETI